MFSVDNFLFLFVAIFFMRFVIFGGLEYFLTAHKYELKRVWFGDVVTMFVYIMIVYPVAMYLSNKVGVQALVPQFIETLPLLVRVFLYLIVADFIHYWLHRLMHTKWLWRIHKWHHSADHMGFTAGFRASILDATVVNLAYIFAWPLLGTPSLTLQFVLLVFALLKNDWMHLNIRTGLPYLEKIIVTPRYHHIHHSSEERYYNKNLSPLFPIWDKLFGTYADPENMKELTFGINDSPSKIRLVIGL